MSRAVVLLCFVLLAAYAAGNLIRDDDVTTKDVKIPRDDVSSANDVVPNEEALVDVEKNEVETPAEVSETEPHVECQQIGQFVSFYRRIQTLFYYVRR